MPTGTELVLVILESPLKGDYVRNRAYARACVLDSLKRGEAPFAGHLLYAQEGILDDTVHEQRELGIAAHLAYLTVVRRMVVYCDLGISEGMQLAIDHARVRGLDFTCRYGVWDDAEIKRWEKLAREEAARIALLKGV